MRTESRVFTLLAGFLYLATVVYAVWTTTELGEVEWAGTIELALTGTLVAMCGFYFAFVARRIEPRPEDRPDADLAEGAGEVGFFSPGSYWPFGLGLGAAVAGLGLVFWQWWLIIAGLLGAVAGTCGLLFEYYSGTRRPAE